jgi:hypothetical protein
MGARGKKSTASMSVVQPGGITAIRRPQPQSGLTDEQSDIWRNVVNRLPADWFPAETHDMLSQYCRHVVSSRRVADLIEMLLNQKEFAAEDYDRLLKMQEREGRAMSALATRMRFSQQSTQSKDRNKGTLVKQPHKM